MSLAARCPECKTLNPTTAALLQAQSGHLTCSHCGNLFSGVDHLTPADEDSWTRLQSPDGDAGDEADNATPAAANGKSSALTGLKRFLRTPAFVRKLKDRTATWPRFARRWTLILGILLLVQVLWWQRLAIAVAMPFLSPAIQGVSRAVGADLAGSASSRLKILASSLKSAQENRLQLEVRIRNESRTPSRWPAFDVQLLDSKRGVVSSITLNIADYAVVGNGTPSGTLQPGEDAEIIAWIDTSVLNAQSLELPVTGFKVSLADSPPATKQAASAHH